MKWLWHVNDRLFGSVSVNVPDLLSFGRIAPQHLEYPLQMRASPCGVGPMTHLSHAHVCNQHCQHGGIAEGHDWPCSFWHRHWAWGMEMSQQPEQHDEWKQLLASKLLMLHGYTPCKHKYTHSKAHYAKATCYSACSHRDGKVTCVVGLLARWGRQLHGPILGWIK